MFFCFALITNLLVSALLVLGVSAVITAVTGMNVYAASMLIPASVLLYTATGGLLATFTSSYVHTAIIYVALCLFTLSVYAGSKDLGLGSIERVRPVQTLLPMRAGSHLLLLQRIDACAAQPASVWAVRACGSLLGAQQTCRCAILVPCRAPPPWWHFGRALAGWA